MKRELLLICMSLLSVTLSAQQIHSAKIGKSRARIEQAKKQKTEQQKLLDAKWKETESKVKSLISSYKMEQLVKAVETVNVNLLDEIIINEESKWAFTYTPKGMRDEEKLYVLNNNNEWILDPHSTRKYNYTYDDLGRCIGRTISQDGTITNKLEISYQDGNRYNKYYESRIDEVTGQPILMIISEAGFDSEKRNILNKYYENGVLRTWEEKKYNDKGEQISGLYWNSYGVGQTNGNKSEVIQNGLEYINSYYEWDNNTNDWRLTSREKRQLNDFGREVLSEYLSYHGSSVNGSRETYTYDNYKRIVETIYAEYQNDKFVDIDKEEYTYWGTEYYGPEGNDMDWEGPVLTYKYYEFVNGEWELNESSTIIRNESGIATSATSIEYDNETINGEDIDTELISNVKFDSKGNFTESETNIYKRDDHSLLYITKDEYTYDTKDRVIGLYTWKKNPNESDWTLIDEEFTEYDNQDRETLRAYRYFNEDGNWSGSKTTLTYNGTITELRYYNIIPSSGEFKSTPNSFHSDGKLDNGNYLQIDQSYDENGNIIGGSKRENQRENTFIIAIPNPEYNNDGLDMSNGEYQIVNTFYDAQYNWEDGNWRLLYERGFQKIGNELVNSYREADGVIRHKEVYSFDSENRLSALKIYRENEILVGQTSYEYNNDGLLSKKDDNGTITIYKYSKHEVTGIEKNTVSTFKVYGNTIIADSAEAPITIYSMSGTQITNGIGTVTVPEKGLYIIVSNDFRQKIAIQ